MKWKPQDVDAMTFAELHAAFDGFSRANGGDAEGDPTEAHFLRVLMEEQVAGRA